MALSRRTLSWHQGIEVFGEEAYKKKLQDFVETKFHPGLDELFLQIMEPGDYSGLSKFADTFKGTFLAMEAHKAKESIYNLELVAKKDAEQYIVLDTYFVFLRDAQELEIECAKLLGKKPYLERFSMYEREVRKKYKMPSKEIDEIVVDKSSPIKEKAEKIINSCKVAVCKLF